MSPSQSSSAATIDYGPDAVVLVFGEGPCRETCAMVTAAGARAVVVPIAQAAARIEMQAAVDAVVIELEDDPGAPLDALADRLNALPPELAGLAIVPMFLTDRIWAAITHPGIVLLAAPDPVERDMELALLVARAARRIAPVVAEPSARLRQLSEEMVRIAQLLGTLSAEVAELRATLPAEEAEPGSPPDPAAIRAIIRTRRLRDRFFGAELFADPAWDMLLDLTAARLEGREVAVSSLCIAAAVPPTTALRWIRTLTHAGLFERRADPGDGRRVFIAISDRGADAMAAYLRAAQAVGTVVG